MKLLKNLFGNKLKKLAEKYHNKVKELRKKNRK